MGDPTVNDDVLVSDLDDQVLISDEIKVLTKSFNEFVQQYSENDEADDLYRIDRDKLSDEFTTKVSEFIDKPDEGNPELVEMNDLLTTLVENTQPVEAVGPTDLDQVSFYADVSIIVLVLVVFPCYLVYRIIKSVFGFTQYI